MNRKYDLDDFEKIVKREASVKEIAEKYGVSSKTLTDTMSKRGYRVHRRIKIVSPYKTIIVQDKQKCADELNVSRQTVINALKGKSVPTLDELNIKILYEDEELTL